MMLRELYVVDLNQLRDGLRQMLLEWPVLSARAESNAVRTALDEHYTDTRAQLDRIETLLSDLDERPRSPEIDSVAPLVRLARLRYAELGSSEVRDLALVTSSSLVDCHLLGLYGAACAGARAVGHPEAVRTLTGLIAEQQGWLERLACLREALVVRLGATPQTADLTTTLMPGVWATETSGFAAVPPRATADLAPAPPHGDAGAGLPPSAGT